MTESVPLSKQISFQTSSQTSSVQTADRISQILDCFSKNVPQLNMTQISKVIGLSTSTTHRLLGAMEKNGLLGRAPDGKKYQLGHRLLHWGAIAQASTSIQLQARPLLEELTHETRETAVLTIRDGNWAICVDRVDSPNSLLQTMALGKRIPLHAGSSAKVLLAWQSSLEIEQIIEEVGLPKLLDNTITKYPDLLLNLKKIREQGYAVSFEERDPGTAGLTVPIFDNHGKVIAGMGIIGPIVRLSADMIQSHLPTLTARSARLSALQGYS
ncbi:MAG: DNA-binding IclR family transcriptional regulator [Candidatus Promineifilaceae bacterium]|jgi:DNA-binding IclR family transcriptional regulator